MIAASVAAFAAEGDPKITITAPTGHTYQIFQVFTGKLDAGKLVSLKYGQNTSKTEGDAVSQTDMETLVGLGKAQNVRGDDAQDLIDTLETFVNFDSNPIAEVTSTTATEGLPTGYYVIKDKDNTVPDSDAATLYMFQVLGADLSIAAKSDKPSSEKKVDDVNDSSDAAADNKTLQDSADYDIGDSIPYTLTFKLPSNYADFEHYYVKFKDTLAPGLTYNSDAVIHYGATDTEGTALNADFGSGLNLAYEIMDLKTSQPDLVAGDVITINYTCTLNASAVIGGSGNTNTYKVEYSSNPNSTGDGTSKPETKETPDDTVIVFTYKTVFNKVDEDGNALSGADFTLNKWVDGEWVSVTALHTGDGAVNPAKATSKSDDDLDSADIFTFSGLDDGKYQLVESTTPTGYNTMEPLVFWIVAEHKETDANPGAETLTVFKIMNEDKSEQIDGTDLTFTATKAEGTAEADIENKSGVELPSTGGMGTTVLYIAGSILVLAAAILLVTKRRMGAED